MIVADVSDDDSLENMCSKASVIINCVGPVSGGREGMGLNRVGCETSLLLQYTLYGEPVVKACIKEKCNYVDITGETYVSPPLAPLHLTFLSLPPSFPPLSPSLPTSPSPSLSLPPLVHGEDETRVF